MTRTRLSLAVTAEVEEVTGVLTPGLSSLNQWENFQSALERSFFQILFIYLFLILPWIQVSKTTPKVKLHRKSDF